MMTSTRQYLLTCTDILFGTHNAGRPQDVQAPALAGHGMYTVHFGLRDSLWVSIDDREIRGAPSGEQRAQDDTTAGAVADEHGV